MSNRTHTYTHPTQIRYAFPYQPYGGAPTLRTGLLADHFSHRTAMRDFNEVGGVGPDVM